MYVLASQRIWGKEDVGASKSTRRSVYLEQRAPVEKNSRMDPNKEEEGRRKGQRCFVVVDD